MPARPRPASVAAGMSWTRRRRAGSPAGAGRACRRRHARIGVLAMARTSVSPSLPRSAAVRLARRQTPGAAALVRAALLVARDVTRCRGVALVSSARFAAPLKPGVGDAAPTFQDMAAFEAAVAPVAQGNRGAEPWNWPAGAASWAPLPAVRVSRAVAATPSKGWREPRSRTRRLQGPTAAGHAGLAALLPRDTTLAAFRLRPPPGSTWSPRTPRPDCPVRLDLGGQWWLFREGSASDIRVQEGRGRLPLGVALQSGSGI